jgi:hypothetical protein
MGALQNFILQRARWKSGFQGEDYALNFAPQGAKPPFFWFLQAGGSACTISFTDQRYVFIACSILQQPL